ncbi:hypothetical protein [Streptomyces sp. 6N223]|uniref:hypothetical protein n=1 Tax=Streptomyces sp. 6N223 TaxID=3457412 RepID=UPI003FD568FE
MTILGIIIGAVLGGMGGVILGRWLSRAQADLRLVSISKGRGEEEKVEVPSDLMRSLEDFRWAPEGLAGISEHRQIVASREEVENFHRKIAPKIMEARTLNNRVQTAETRDVKLEIIQELIAPEMKEEICSGLRTLDFDLPSVSYPENAERFCDIREAEAGGVPTLEAVFTRFAYTFSYEEASAVSLDRIRPFVLALQHFDKNALGRCLDYADKAVRQEVKEAELLITRLDKLLHSDQFILEVVISNKGDRLTVLSPHAALLVKSPGDKIPPLPLRISGIQHQRQDLPEITEPTAYLAIAPQTADRYVFLSEPLDTSPPLKGAYDSGLLECAVVANRESARGKKKRIQSHWVSFGTGLSERLREEAIAQAGR